LTQSRNHAAAVAAVLLGVAASVAANILHAQPNPIAQTIAAWPPVALLLTVELISRVPVDRRALAAVRLLTTTGIAGIAAWVSYSHMQGVAARYGEAGASPYLLPLSVDGLVVVASVSHVELAGRLRVAETTTVSAPAAAVPTSLAVPAGKAGPHVPPLSLDAGTAGGAAPAGTAGQVTGAGGAAHNSSGSVSGSGRVGE
jgi:hypothetical protein